MINDSCIEVKKLSYRYNNEHKILDNVNFSLGKGEIISCIGPNGCGKTTLLNLIAGFLNPSAGEIVYHHNGKSKLFSSVVFQDSALLDWKSAFRNVELSLIATVKNPVERKGIIEGYLDILGI